MEICSYHSSSSKLDKASLAAVCSSTSKTYPKGFCSGLASATMSIVFGSKNGLGCSLMMKNSLLQRIEIGDEVNIIEDNTHNFG